MPISTKAHDVMFTGGVPGLTAGTVFEALSAAVGGRALGLPDGDIGDRRGWITVLAATTWGKVDGLAEISSPIPDDHPGAHWFRTFKIKDGVESLDLKGLLPYSRGALESYPVFKRFREEGTIDPEVRFQVGIPGAHDAVALHFPDPADWKLALSAWTDAVQDEYWRMLEVIPADDLIIQLDYCTELVDIAGFLADVCTWDSGASSEEKFAIYTGEDYLAAHTAGLSEDVPLGYHICAGTWPKQPVAEIDDISLPVRIANALAVNSGRRVDFFHMPALRDSDEHYFVPLKDLDVGEAAVYLGLECNDGLDAMERRISYAKSSFSDFGVAHYCGYTLQADILPQLLDDLGAGADFNARH